jgi:hypothetical protein
MLEKGEDMTAKDSTGRVTPSTENTEKFKFAVLLVDHHGEFETRDRISFSRLSASSVPYHK